MKNKEELITKRVQELQVDIIREFVNWYTEFKSPIIKGDMIEAVCDFVSVKALSPWVLDRISYTQGVVERLTDERANLIARLKFLLSDEYNESIDIIISADNQKLREMIKDAILYYKLEGDEEFLRYYVHHFEGHI